MGTNKIALRTVEEVMADYQPTYQPVYPLFMGNSQAFAPDVGQLNFTRVETIGDIRAKHMTPKDTIIAQVAAKTGTKSFKKYFFANQFVLSQWQDRQGVEDVFAQVLDEHQKQMDDLVLKGEGTQNSDVVNNGLFFSLDPNHTTETSAAIASSGRLLDFHSKVVTNATKADTVRGRKAVVFYGTNILPLYNSLYDNGLPWKKALQDVLGANYSLMSLPAEVTPSSNHGWMIVNLDQIKLNYTLLPGIQGQGVDERNMEVWANFAMGSTMVEVLALNGVIRQPATLA
jgi:hypothetical protein